MKKTFLNRLNQKNKNLLGFILRCLIVFIIPIIAGLLFYKKLEVHPFGNKSILSIDLWGQYFPMYRQFADTDSFAEAMYSWKGGLGFNNFLQSSYYCRSPFLLIFKLVPLKHSISFINTIALLRFGLSALTCHIFLEYKFRKKTPLLMACSVCYGLCAYAIAYIMQFMWNDLIFYAPLVLLGLELLIKGKSPFLYVFMLALAIYTNFYIGFGVCLFTLFYFVSEIIKKTEYDPSSKFIPRVSNFKYIKNTVIKFSLYSLLAGCINAVIAIPTLTGISNAQSANTKAVDFSEWYFTFADNINALLPDNDISLGYGIANISTGLFMFVLVPLYFMTSSIKFRDKLASGAFLAILYCGLNYNPMDYLFNGFHFPNQLPGRCSFLFSLAIVITAANVIAIIDKIKHKNLICSWALSVFFMLMARYSQMTDLRLEKINSWILWITIFYIVLAVYLILLKVKKAQKTELTEKTEKDTDNNNIKSENTQKALRKTIISIGPVLCALILSVTMTFEVCSNSINTASKPQGGIPVSNKVSYDNNMTLITKYGKKYKNDNDEFYRTEINKRWTFNDGLLGDYNGISYYSSTLNYNVYNLMQFLGNHVYAQNASTCYNNSSIVQNGIFGVRYFIDRNKNLSLNVPGIDKIEQYGEAVIWENPTALPLAFAVSENIKSFKVTNEIRPIRNQNNLINMMYGEEINVFEKHSTTSFSYENADFSEDKNWNNCYFYRQNINSPVKINYKYISPGEVPLYIEHNYRTGKIVVTVNDVSTELDQSVERFKNIGTYPAGTEINISVEISEAGSGNVGLDMYSFNFEKWNNVYNKLNNNSLDISSFKSNKVEGTINMSSSGTVFTSIPQDGGWKVYVDGKKVTDFMIADALIGINLDSGSHEIVFKYSVPGFASGLTITVISILITLFCLWYRKNGYKLFKKKEAVTENDIENNDTKLNDNKHDECEVKDKKSDLQNKTSSK